MSQVYSELGRLEKRGLVSSRVAAGYGNRNTRRFAITREGEQDLGSEQRAGIPTLKHSVALRLFLGHLADPERTRDMLTAYAERLQTRIPEIEAIRAELGEDPSGRYPPLVADWRQTYYAAEIAAVRELADRVKRGDMKPE